MTRSAGHPANKAATTTALIGDTDAPDLARVDLIDGAILKFRQAAWTATKRLFGFHNDFELSLHRGVVTLDEDARREDALA